MDRDAKLMRGAGPTLFCQVKHNVGIPEMVQHITTAYRAAAAKAAAVEAANAAKAAAEPPDSKRAKH